MKTRVWIGFVAVVCVHVAGCATSELTPAGSRVAVVRESVPSNCKTLKYLIGKGGGSFGGSYISNEGLIEYAMNDLRNQAAEIGATHVHADPPQLGAASGTTTSVTITGTAYQCPSEK